MKLPELLQQKPFVHDTQPHRVPHPAFSTWSESRVGVSSWDQPAHYVLCSGFNTFVLRRTNDDRPKGVNEQRHLQFWSEQRFTFSTCLLSFQSVPVVIYKTHSLHVNGDLNDFIVLHKNLIRSKCTLTFALSSSGLVRCDHTQRSQWQLHVSTEAAHMNQKSLCDTTWQHQPVLSADSDALEAAHSSTNRTKTLLKSVKYRRVTADGAEMCFF